MTLDDLRVFVAVCKAGSLSEVARRQHCTQPAVSQHISRLERELGVRLLERGASGVAPTGVGEVLRDAALEGLGALAAGIQRMRELEGSTTPVLTVTTGATTVRHFLRETVVRFRREHSDTRIEFLPANTTADCLEHVRTGQAELALVTLERPQQGMEQLCLARQHLRLLSPLDDCMAGRRRIKLQELENLRYIGLASRTTSSGHIEQALSKHGMELRKTMTVDDFDTACVFVELGIGYAIVPAVQAADFERSARVKSTAISGLPALPIGLAARRWSALSHAARAFVGIFRTELGRMHRIPGFNPLGR